MRKHLHRCAEKILHDCADGSDWLIRHNVHAFISNEKVSICGGPQPSQLFDVAL